MDKMSTEGFYVPTDADREKFKDMSIVVLVPCGDYKSNIRFVHCMVNMVAYSWRHGLHIDCMGFTERTMIQWARNNLAHSFVKGNDPYTGKPFTHALWLDDDHVFNPDMGVRLAALGHLDMVSAVYVQRTAPFHPVAYVKSDSENEFLHWPVMDMPDETVEIDAVGFGALLMRREVLEGTPEPWFTLDSRSGEDVAFCVQAKKAGYRVWLAGDYKIGHMGVAPVVTMADSLKHREEHPEDYGDKVRIAMNKA